MQDQISTEVGEKIELLVLWVNQLFTDTQNNGSLKQILYEAEADASERGRKRCILEVGQTHNVQFYMVHFGLALLPSRKCFSIISGESKHQSGRSLFACCRAARKTSPAAPFSLLSCQHHWLGKCSSYCSGMTVGSPNQRAPYRVCLVACYFL